MANAYQKHIKIYFSPTIKAPAAVRQKTAEGAANLRDFAIDDFIMRFCTASVYQFFRRLGYIFGI